MLRPEKGRSETVTEIKALRYYSHGKWSDPERAQDEVDKLKAKHPDREYAILINMRGAYKRYTVAQVQEIAVDWPTDADLITRLGPPPIAPPGAYQWEPTGSWERQQWEDYDHERCKHNDAVRRIRRPALAALHGKMNP